MKKEEKLQTRRAFLPIFVGMLFALPALAVPLKNKQKKKKNKNKNKNKNGDPVADATKLYKQGDYQGVIGLLAPMAAENPPPGCHRLLGLSYHHLGDHGKAVPELQAAVLEEPGNQDVLFALGMSQGHKGDHGGKVDSLNRLIAVNPKHAYGHYELGNACNELGKMDLVVHHYQEFVGLAPDAPEAERVRAILAQLGY